MRGEKKHIDRVFQEKFKDFEVSPSMDLWSKIESKLDENKPRKVVPLWWKVAGIAASFAVLLTVWFTYQSNFTNPGSSVVNQNNIENQLEIEAAPAKTNLGFSTELTVDEAIEITSSESSTPKNTTTSQPSLTDKSTNTEALQANSISESYVLNNSANTSSKDYTLKAEGAITSIDSEISTPLTQNNFNSILTSLKNNLTTHPIAVDEIAARDISRSKVPRSFGTEKYAEEKLLAQNNPLSTQQTSEEIAEEAQENLANKQKHLWSLKPQVSPVFNLAANSGASIDPMLGNNSSQGNTSLAYGMLVTYTLATNLRLRSGVQQVNMSYTTNDVVFAPAVAGVASNQINFNVSAEGFNVFNQLIYDANADPNSRTFAASGDLQQQLGFVEIPLEVEWQLIDGKFGVYASGGASSLFLLQNSVGLRNETGVWNIGENAAANNTSFSGNLGLGLEYQLTRRFNLNLEPSLRYQFNTFSNQIEGFNPYFFAIYTGVNLKF